jgi:hypothetical protein
MEDRTERWEDLVDDLVRLVRAHAELVRLEGQEAVGDLLRGGFWVVVGLAALAGAVAFLPALATLVLALWLPAWAAALVSWGGVASLGVLGLWAGWRRLSRPKLAKVREVLREDARWVRELTVSMRSSGKPGSGSP